MKNLFLKTLSSLLLLTVILIITFVSCTKEDTQQNTETSINILESLFDKNDQENTKINQIIFHFASAIEKAKTNNTFLKLIIDEVNASGINQVSIFTIAETNESFKEFLNTELAKTIVQTPNFKFSSKDYVSELTKIMKYNDYSYVPVAYTITPNIKVSENENIIFAIGAQVNANDEIIGWIEGKATLISENFAMQNISSLIIIGNGDQKTIDAGNTVPAIYPGFEDDYEDNSVTNGNASLRATYDIDLDLHQIKDGFRYERSGKSEVRGFSLRHTCSSCTSSSLKEMQHNTIKISKRDISISKTFFNDKEAIDEDSGNWDSSSQNYFMGYWENDWYAGLKLILNPCTNSPYNSVLTKRKFFHEWYNFWCGTGTSMLPSAGTTFNITNMKSRFQLKR